MTETRTRAPHGSVRRAVLEWLEGKPEGQAFHYTDISDPLGIPRPSVSGTCRMMTRKGNPPLLLVGPYSGWYTIAHAVPAARHEPAYENPLDDYAEVSSPQQQPRGDRTGQKMEVLGARLDGNLLLRALDGTLWTAVQE